MTRKSKSGNVKLQHLFTVVEVGEMLAKVLTPQERSELGMQPAKLETIQPKRRYRKQQRLQ